MGYSHEVAKPDPAVKLSARAGAQHKHLEEELKRRLASAAERAGLQATQKDALKEFGLM